MTLQGLSFPYRRWLVVALTLALTGVASSLFLPRLFAGTPDFLDYACASVFVTVTVAGCFNFWLFVIGFFLSPSPADLPSHSFPLLLNRRRDGNYHTAALCSATAERGNAAESEFGTPEITTRTALVMPIYNEDVERVYLGIRQTWLSVLRTGLGEHCDFFILSDCTKAEIQAQEDELLERLAREFGRAAMLRRPDLPLDVERPTNEVWAAQQHSPTACDSPLTPSLLQ